MNNNYELKAIAGLRCAVFPADESGAPLVFVLHGLYGDMYDSYAFCEELQMAGLCAIAIEHRNHGSRCFEPAVNKSNDELVIDRMGVLIGTAHDVSTVLDFAPAKLAIKPRSVGITGISLGGHACYRAMMIDERITAAVPIISSASGIFQLKDRIKTGYFKHADTYEGLVSAQCDELLRKYEPPLHPERFADKKVLMLNGADDEGQPIAGNEDFVKKVQAVSKGKDCIRLKLYEGVGHSCTQGMRKDAVDFLAGALLI